MKEIKTYEYSRLSRALQEYLIVNLPDVESKRLMNKRIASLFSHLGFDCSKDSMIYQQFRIYLLANEILSAVNLVIAYKYSRDQNLIINFSLKHKLDIMIKKGTGQTSLLNRLKSKNLIK